ncbi:MAG: hypothetical protein PHS47_04320 [Methanocellales archaeon]|nr:hypothetical protein [Methanocellales archaeon]MDD3421504.1 hypothetical protein [Methanocellales archaeon]MDD4898801.1 hypothetical protein [Methanocellales archaeon]MDD5446621.1 hypothetical protein [Methanocellales archaeon]
MEDLSRIELTAGIIGGIGLGLLLGSEYSGRYATLLGAGLISIFIVVLGALSYQIKKKLGE